MRSPPSITANSPSPLITPLSVTSLPYVSNVPIMPESSKIERLVASVKPEVNYWRAISGRPIFVVGLPGSVPSAASALMLNIPASMTVPPV